MNRKGQLFSQFIIMAFIVIGLLILSPFLLKIFNTSIPAFQNAVGNQSVEAGQAVSYVRVTTIGFWDSVVLFMFLILVVLLVVSSFLIDVHPFFIVMYIIVGIFFFALAPAVSPILYAIYESPNFSTEVSQIPALEFIVGHFWTVILGVYLFTGLIMFVKVRYFASGGSR